MQGLSTLKNGKVTRCLNAVAAGTSEQAGASVDMSDFEAVTFVAAFGAITASATTGMKVQQSDDDGGADDWTDLEGSAQAITPTDDDKIVAVEVVRPLKRYLRPVVTRGVANAVIDGVIALQTHPRKPPVAQSASVAGSKVMVSPAEGTA